MDANLSSDQLELIANLIEEAIKPLREQVEKVEDNLLDLAMKLDNKASDGHYHDDYASADHVERSENNLGSQISRLRDTISNLEYRVSDAERKAEHAQSTADDARRSVRGGW